MWMSIYLQWSTVHRRPGGEPVPQQAAQRRAAGAGGRAGDCVGRQIQSARRAGHRGGWLPSTSLL